MRIGVDLGGTKIEAIALDRGGRIAARRRAATPRDDYAGTLDAIRRLVAEVEDEAGARGTVGVGMPGALSRRSGRVKNANSTWLNGRPFDRDLEATLGRPVRVANDANCFALSEASDGAGAGAGVVFGVILGTGVGGGLVVDGRIVEGLNAVGGEWGHMPLPWPRDDERPGAACYCGRRGCVETWLSGPGFASWAAGEFGAEGGTERIAAAAEAGDDRAAAAVRAYSERLGRALAVVVDIVDPDVIVLGGGVSGIEALYRLTPEHVSRHAFSDGVDTPIRKAVHGASSGVRGAAWLWPEP